MNSKLNEEQFEHDNLKEHDKVQKVQKDKQQHELDKKVKTVSDQPHPLDRHSGTGIGKEMKKHGQGKGNWGTFQDDLRNQDAEEEEVRQQPTETIPQQETKEEESKESKENEPVPELDEQNFPKLQ